MYYIIPIHSLTALCLFGHVSVTSLLMIQLPII